MKKMFYLILCLSGLVWGCQPNNIQRDDMANQVRQTSQELWDLMGKPYDSTSLKQFMGFFSANYSNTWQDIPEQVLVLNTDITKLSDWEKDAQNIMDSRKQTDITMTEIHESVLSHEKVLQISRGDFSVILKNGSVSGPYTMANTILWGKEKEGWKILFWHQSWDDNKIRKAMRDLLDQWVAYFNSDPADPDLSDFFSDDYVYHLPGRDIRGRDAYTAAIKDLILNSKDFTVTPEMVTYGPERISVRWSSTYIDRKTGRKMSGSVISIDRYSEGKFVESWEVVSNEAWK
jgi:hypothetical protein